MDDITIMFTRDEDTLDALRHIASAEGGDIGGDPCRHHLRSCEPQ